MVLREYNFPCPMYGRAYTRKKLDRLEVENPGVRVTWFEVKHWVTSDFTVVVEGPRGRVDDALAWLALVRRTCSLVGI